MVQSLITEKFRTQLSNLFIDSINDANLNYYLVIAHVNAWANDSIPDSPVDTRDTEVNIWRSMIGGKKVTGNDLYHVVPRIDWTANTVYAQYTDRNTSIYGTNFYVVTSEFNVYKCIDNNYSANSVIMPTYTKYDQLNTETDGYVWKYMYSLTDQELLRFTIVVADASLGVHHEFRPPDGGCAHHDQLDMCSLIYMAARPEVQKVKSSYIWLKFGKVTTDEMRREDTPKAWEKLIGRIAKLEEAYDTDVWLPKTSGLCNGWCPVGPTNCPHWKPKRQ